MKLSKVSEDYLSFDGPAALLGTGINVMLK
jgi:hypothetical protein